MPEIAAALDSPVLRVQMQPAALPARKIMSNRDDERNELTGMLLHFHFQNISEANES